MSALVSAGAPGSRNQLMRVNHMGLYPAAKAGDYLFWQPIAGFHSEGLYVISIGDGARAPYLVQNCGGTLRLLWPMRDIDPKTGAIRPGVRPQEMSIAAFSDICIGIVVATVQMAHEAAFLGREELEVRPYLAPARRLEGAL